MTLSVVIVLVQQQNIIKKMRQLNSQIKLIKFRASSIEVRRQRLLLERVKFDYLKTNRTTIQLSSAISAYSKQWTVYLSTTLPVQTVGVAYVAYVFFFGNLPYAIRYLFIMADSAVILTIFTQLNLCAQVVRYSETYVQQTDVFVRGLHQLKKLLPVEQIKMCQSTSLKKEFAFRFLDDNTLNPSTFPMVNPLFFKISKLFLNYFLLQIFTYCTTCILMIAKKT